MGVATTAAGKQVRICRREPPRVFVAFLPTREGGVTDVSNTYWPTINAGDWCGEHQTAIALAN